MFRRLWSKSVASIQQCIELNSCRGTKKNANKNSLNKIRSWENVQILHNSLEQSIIAQPYTMAIQHTVNTV